jgi:hypothetical protein
MAKIGEKFKFYDLIVYADRGSNSARTLAHALGCRRWRADMPERYTRRRAFFKGFKSPVIINWGTPRKPEWRTIADSFRHSAERGLILNTFHAIETARNKLACFKALDAAKVPCLRWTTKKEDVEKWLRKGKTVFARRTITGAGGAGITILQTGDAHVVDAPLYTRNFPKTHEFRLHVAFGRVIDLTEKRARTTDGRAHSRYIRNARNGWVFAHQLSRLQPDDRASMERTAVSAIAACGLDFGAVDMLAIIAQPEEGGRLQKHVVCEINTGPGLENTETIGAYEEAFRVQRTKLRQG